jgi:hypothetical protein
MVYHSGCSHIHQLTIIFKIPADSRTVNLHLPTLSVDHSKLIKCSSLLSFTTSKAHFSFKRDRSGRSWFVAKNHMIGIWVCFGFTGVYICSGVTCRTRTCCTSARLCVESTSATCKPTASIQRPGYSCRIASPTPPSVPRPIQHKKLRNADCFHS